MFLSQMGMQGGRRLAFPILFRLVYFHFDFSAALRWWVDALLPLFDVFLL